MVASITPIQRHHSPNLGDLHQPMQPCQVPQTHSLPMTLGATINLDMQGRISLHMLSQIITVLRGQGSLAMSREVLVRLASIRVILREAKGRYSAQSVGHHHQATITPAGNARRS